MTSKHFKRLTAKSKVWLECDGEAVFGDGKLQWLELIEQTGSLKAAAGEIGMSYRGLWGRLRQMEQRLGIKLVTRKAGGKGGGGSQLTPAGCELMRRYRRFRKGLDKLLDAHFNKAFHVHNSSPGSPSRR